MVRVKNWSVWFLVTLVAAGLTYVLVKVAVLQSYHGFQISNIIFDGCSKIEGADDVLSGFLRKEFAIHEESRCPVERGSKEKDRHYWFKLSVQLPQYLQLLDALERSPRTEASATFKNEDPGQTAFPPTWWNKIDFKGSFGMEYRADYSVARGRKIVFKLVKVRTGEVYAFVNTW